MNYKKHLHHIQSFDIFLKTKKGFWVIITSIVLLNTIFYAGSHFKSFSGKQARRDASGFSIEKGSPFLYFYYYTGNFPLATLDSNLVHSQEGAMQQISKNGKDLIMEYEHWSRLGEHARILAFLPNAYWRGTPQNPSIKLFNALVFVMSLIVLFVGFWKINRALIGFFLVVMINLTPFFLYEVYSRENIFALLGSTFFIILGLNISVLFSKKINYLHTGVAGIWSSVMIGFFSEIRNEVSIVLLSLLLIYLLSTHLRFIPKLIYLVLFLLCFNGTKQAIRGYFNLKYNETAALVEAHGGHVYTGKRISGHKIWHPLFCGLGDFDTKYGYEWNDKVAYRYAVPILKEKYNLDIHYSDKYYTDDYYDEDKIYYIKFDEIEEYDEVVKEKVLHDILNDPLWYVTIIFKRIARTLTTTIPVPYIGWLLFPLVFFLIKNKRWEYLNLIIISLPLSVTSIVIYSGKGSTYNSVFVFMILVVIAASRFANDE